MPVESAAAAWRPLYGSRHSHTAKVSYGSQMQTTMQTLGYDNVFIGTVEGEPEDTSPLLRAAVIRCPRLPVTPRSSCARWVSVSGCRACGRGCGCGSRRDPRRRQLHLRCDAGGRQRACHRRKPRRADCGRRYYDRDHRLEQPEL